MGRALEGVKAGSKIKVRRSIGEAVEVHAVERVTETRAVCARLAFSIETGLLIGSGSFRKKVYGSLTTDENFKQAEIAARIRMAKSKLNKFTVTADNLEAVEALLKGVV